MWTFFSSDIELHMSQNLPIQANYWYYLKGMATQTRGHFRLWHFLFMLTVVGRGTPCFLIEAQVYILGGMPVWWRQNLFWGNASQTTPTVSFFNSLDCLGHNLESSAFTSPLKKLKMLTTDTYVMSPEIVRPPINHRGKFTSMNWFITQLLVKVRWQLVLAPQGQSRQNSLRRQTVLFSGLCGLISSGDLCQLLVSSSPVFFDFM